jgi:hypothetical protein
MQIHNGNEWRFVALGPASQQVLMLLDAWPAADAVHATNIMLL